MVTTTRSCCKKQRSCSASPASSATPTERMPQTYTGTSDERAITFCSDWGTENIKCRKWCSSLFRLGYSNSRIGRKKKPCANQLTNEAEKAVKQWHYRRRLSQDRATAMIHHGITTELYWCLGLFVMSHNSQRISDKVTHVTSHNKMYKHRQKIILLIIVFSIRHERDVSIPKRPAALQSTAAYLTSLYIS